MSETKHSTIKDSAKTISNPKWSESDDVFEMPNVETFQKDYFLQKIHGGKILQVLC